MSKNSLMVSVIITVLLMPAGDSAGKGFELLSRSLLQGPSRDAEFFDEGLIIAAGGGILIASPAESLSSAGHILLGGEPQDITVRENTAYIAIWREGLVTVDLSDPGDPVTYKNYKAKQAAKCCTCVSSLFVWDNEKGLLVFDLLDPLKPSFREKIKLSGRVLSMSSQADIMAIVTPKNVYVFNIAANGEVTRLKDLKVKPELKNGLLGGGILYLVSRDGNVSRWDFSVPKRPKRLPDLPLDP